MRSSPLRRIIAPCRARSYTEATVALMTWKKAASATDLDAGPIVFNHSPKQIALCKAGGQVYAVDNRCPHEGYPLTQGHVDDNCVLTCNWHNWKFRLQDGKCILGGDHVRGYPVKAENGDLWVDVQDPPPEQIQETVLEALRTAFDDRDFGRICREITRLHYNQLDPLAAVRKAIEWSHDRFEFGFTHAYGAGADWLARSRIYKDDWEKQLVCLAEAVDHMAFDALRQPAFPFAEPGEPFDAEAFAAVVEMEQTKRAEAMVPARIFGWPALGGHGRSFRRSCSGTLQQLRPFADLRIQGGTTPATRGPGDGTLRSAAAGPPSLLHDSGRSVAGVFRLRGGARQLARDFEPNRREPGYRKLLSWNRAGILRADSKLGFQP